MDLGSAGEEKVEFIPLGPGVGWRREAFCQYLFLLDLGSAGEELCHGFIVIVPKLSLFLFSVLRLEKPFFELLVFRAVTG